MAHTAPVRLSQRAVQRTVLKKKLHEAERSFRCLKNRIGHAIENGLTSIESLLPQFQSVPVPLALCNMYGEKHKSGKAAINKGMKTLLTEGQLDRHRNERRPRGSHVLSCGFLLQINGSFYAKFRPNSMDSCIEIGSKRRWPSS